jgi:hypothetical protein
VTAKEGSDAVQIRLSKVTLKLSWCAFPGWDAPRDVPSSSRTLANLVPPPRVRGNEANVNSSLFGRQLKIRKVLKEFDTVFLRRIGGMGDGELESHGGALMQLAR